MITMYTARTQEIDDVEAAIAEIKSQIDFSLLKKHTGGIIFCEIDAIESGMISALCKALPFDVIGMTSMGSACSKGHGFFDLSLTVLTSNEVSFMAGMSNSITHDNFENEIDTLYKNMRGKVNADPSLIISFMPMNGEIAGYKFVVAADKSTKGIPIWGSFASSMNIVDYRTVGTFFCRNSEFGLGGITMLFMNGPITPKFVINSLPEYNISKTRGVVTKSDGATVQEINDIPALDYFSNMGIQVTAENVRATPLIVYHNGRTEPVALAFYTVNEDGSILVGCAVPEGCSVAVGGISADTITESCNLGLDDILAIKERDAVLMLPCVSRGVMMVPNQDDELRLVKERLTQENVPFVMGYAGGEICPVYSTGRDGTVTVKNQFHNYTFCACVL